MLSLEKCYIKHLKLSSNSHKINNSTSKPIRKHIFQTQICHSESSFNVPFLSIGIKNYSSISRNGIKKKESVSSKLKMWTETGLLRTASQLPETQVFDAVAPITNFEPPKVEQTFQEDVKGMSSDQILRKEYLELCKQIIDNAKIAKSKSKANAATKRKNAKSHDKADKIDLKSKVKSIETEKVTSKRKQTIKVEKVDSNREPEPIPPPKLPEIIKSVSPTLSEQPKPIKKPGKPKKAVKTKEVPQIIISETITSQETFSSIDQVDTIKESPSIDIGQNIPPQHTSIDIGQNIPPLHTSTATPQDIPSKPDLEPVADWQHEFESDLSESRLSVSQLVSEFEQDLLSNPNYQEYAPLNSLQLRFWQATFPWDAQVELATMKFLRAAAISKQISDPSYIPAPLPPTVSFRNLQKEAINIALAKRDLFLALPTGGGKTLCFALPSLLEKGTTVVISPLISLIEDQANLLNSMGIRAAGISSQMTHEELNAIYQTLLDSDESSDQVVPEFDSDKTGEKVAQVSEQTNFDATKKEKFKLIYVTAERIGRNERFVNVLKEMNRKGLLQRIVVDEAHCISEWGHDFRKDYRKLSILKEMLPNVPIMAVTGTCTEKVRIDIAEQLKMDLKGKKTLQIASNPESNQELNEKSDDNHIAGKDQHITDTNHPAFGIGHYVLQTSFNRKNLWFQVAPKSDAPMIDMLFYILNSGYENQCGIIYAMTTSDAERLSAFFSEQGLSSVYYHGGMTHGARQEAQSKWNSGEAKMMCTTVAFGLGIDKSNVRYVIHSTIPTSLEAFYQQAGRAGRDQNEADCILFYQPKDRVQIEHVIRLNSHALKQRERLREIARINKIKVSLLEKGDKSKSNNLNSSGKNNQETSKKNGRRKVVPNDSNPILQQDEDLFDDQTDIVDIVDVQDIDDSHEGIIRLLKEDGSEILFSSGEHPDIFANDPELGPETPQDAFIRQMKAEKLDDVTSYCREKKTCRRVFLLRYFGQAFVSHQCQGMCDICSPLKRRLTHKLSKKGLETWERLKAQVELKNGKQPANVSSVIKRIQEQQKIKEDAQNTILQQKLSEEDADGEYQLVTLTRKRTEMKKIGLSSPLARKRALKMSLLGDPSEYLDMHERILNSSHERTPTLSFDELQEKFLHSKTSSETEKHTPNTNTIDENESTSLRDLLAEIAKISQEKLERRKKKSSSSSSSLRSRSTIKTEHDDSPSMSRSNWFGIGNPNEAEIEEIRSPTQYINSKSDDESVTIASELSSRHSNLHRDPMPDHHLRNSVRNACLKIAKDLSILPKNVLTQKAIMEVALAKPRTLAELQAIPGVGAKKAIKYADYILPIFESE